MAAKKKTIANKKADAKKATRRSATVAAAVKPALSVQTAKLVKDHGYLHNGADGSPDKSNPVSKSMSVVRAASEMLHRVGSSGITLSQLIANCEASYGSCAGKLRQTFRVWTQTDENGKRLPENHSDYRKNPLCELFGMGSSKIRFKPGKFVRHNNTTLTPTEIVRIGKAKPAKKS